MSTQDFLTHLALLEAEFPKGDVVYHKATGRAFVTVGYEMAGGNEVALSCDPGNGITMPMIPIAMTTTKPLAEKGGGGDDE